MSLVEKRNKNFEKKTWVEQESAQRNIEFII